MTARLIEKMPISSGVSSRAITMTDTNWTIMSL
jgi:hypothetical protein